MEARKKEISSQRFILFPLLLWKQNEEFHEPVQKRSRHTSVMMLTVLLLLKFGDSPLKMYRLVEFRITFHLTRTLRANECRRKKFRINHEFCTRQDKFSLKCQPS